MKASVVKGFTLVELMVTIAVLGIVMLVAVPAFTGLMQGNRLNSQANHLVGALNLAKAEAVRRNQVVIFCHSADSQTCSAPPATGWQGWLIGRARPQPANGIVAGSVIISSTYNAGPLNVSSDAPLNSSNGEIRVFPQGLIRNNASAPLNAAISLCLANAGDNNNRTVDISSGGQIGVRTSTNAACGA